MENKIIKHMHFGDSTLLVFTLFAFLASLIGRKQLLIIFQEQKEIINPFTIWMTDNMTLIYAILLGISFFTLFLLLFDGMIQLIFLGFIHIKYLISVCSKIYIYAIWWLYILHRIQIIPYSVKDYYIYCTKKILIPPAILIIISFSIPVVYVIALHNEYEMYLEAINQSHPEPLLQRVRHLWEQHRNRKHHKNT